MEDRPVAAVLHHQQPGTKACLYRVIKVADGFLRYLPNVGIDVRVKIERRFGLLPDQPPGFGQAKADHSAALRYLNAVWDRSGAKELDRKSVV